FASLNIEKKGIYEISSERLLTTARVLSKSIEGSMVEADATFTRNLIDDLRAVSGYEMIPYNSEGAEAFTFVPSTVSVDDKFLKQVLKEGKELVHKEGTQLQAYLPFHNLPSCKECHFNESPIIGVLKVSISLSKEEEKITSFALFLTLGSFIGIVFLGILLWQVLRHNVILPVKELENASMKMAEGDMSFCTGINSNDEIGRLDISIKESLRSISGILLRVTDVSKRIQGASDVVRRESDKVVENTLIEAESVAEISSSIEELNAAISEIADGTHSLAQSVQDTAASMEELSTTIVSIRDITHEVSEGVETTSSSIEQFSATIKEVVDHADELSRVSDETLAAVEEITSSVKEVEGRAKESAALSHKVTDDASALGVTAMNSTIEGMENIKTSVSQAAEVIRQLGGRSEEIGNILDVIDDIADQTTLLALNAAILAAQAGEHGKGFSVVANEIKDLAERTTMSTQEIDGLIKSVRLEVGQAGHAMDEGMGSVENGIALTREAASALRKMLDSSRKASEMSASIERTTTEQSKTTGYVTESIERVRSMVKEIVKATTEQSKGVSLVIEASEMIREAARKADSATEQQATGTKQISKTIESISEMSLHISRAINEQKMGSKQIWSSVEKIKNVPDANRELAFSMNKALRELSRDSELVNMEMERFTLYEIKRSDIVTLGIIPFEAPVELHRRFTPLVKYLARETGLRFEIRVASDFNAAIQDLEAGETQLCFMSSITYIEGKKRNVLDPLALVLKDGRPVNRSAIITREYGTANELEDLINRSFAFVDSKSVSGYMIPRAMMDDAGVGLDDLSHYNFVGYHDDVVKAVIKGEFEAGAVMESTAQKYIGKGIRILKYSDELPEFNISISKGTPTGVKDKVSAALLKLTLDNPESRDVMGAIIEPYNGLTAARDEDFEQIRKVLSRYGS
ncbi:phosphate/phosphite/phosphonate ABC transporter substrate-binding protein, partial [Nitrospirota bacterium]